MRDQFQINPYKDAARPHLKPGAQLVDWPHDGHRHSFASYHLAHFQKLDALKLQMGHAGDDMIFNHYRALVRPSQAAAYWEILPKKDP